MYTRLEEIFEELGLILENIRKTTNRPYKEKTVKDKLLVIENLFKQYIVEHTQLGKNSKTDLSILTEHKFKTRQTYELAKKKLSAMTDTFDIRTATSLIPVYDGKNEQLDSFTDSVLLMKELTAETHQEILLKFIKTRLIGKAREIVSSGITTTDELLSKLRIKCASKLSSESVLAQLKRAKQGSSSISDFADEIDSLASRLAKTYVSEELATSEAASKLAEKFALEALTNGVRNPETSLILKAGNFTNLSDAISKAITVSMPTSWQELW